MVTFSLVSLLLSPLMLRAEVLGTVNGIRIKTQDAYALSDDK